MSARQVVTFGSCCQSSTFGGFWDLCSFSDQILASSQSSTFGGFWDLDKIWSEKLHLFAQRISDVAYSVCSKCSSPSLGCLRALEPGMSEKCPKSVRKVSEIWSEKLHLFARFWISSPSPTCSPVVSCLQTTLTTWLYIVTWLLLDRLSHLIGGGSETCFGPKSG